MTVKELKALIDKIPEDNEIGICVETPSGFVCPDGCVIGVDRVVGVGIDWHSNETLIVPKYKLRMTESAIEKWKRGE